jgi:hypothetical protein
VGSIDLMGSAQVVACPGGWSREPEVAFECGLHGLGAGEKASLKLGAAGFPHDGALQPLDEADGRGKARPGAGVAVAALGPSFVEASSVLVALMGGTRRLARRRSGRHGLRAEAHHALAEIGSLK